MIAMVSSTDLHAVDGALHRGIEVLNAETGAGESDRRQIGDISGLKRTRIEFDGEVLLPIAEAEVALERFDRVAQLCGRKKIGGPAAEVELDDFAIAVEQRRHEVNFAVQRR